jgi:hypothetical protein
MFISAPWDCHNLTLVQKKILCSVLQLECELFRLVIGVWPLQEQQGERGCLPYLERTAHATHEAAASCAPLDPPPGVRRLRRHAVSGKWGLSCHLLTKSVARCVCVTFSRTNLTFSNSMGALQRRRRRRRRRGRSTASCRLAQFAARDR